MLKGFHVCICLLPGILSPLNNNHNELFPRTVFYMNKPDKHDNLV